MAKFWAAAAAAGALATAGTTWAEPGGPTFAQPAHEMTGPGGPPGEYAPTSEDVYGAHPLIRKLCFWKKPAAPVAPSHKHAPMGPYGPLPGLVPNHAPAGAGVPGPGMPGTLVFPSHTYVRSPRDYFMYEPGGR